LFGKRLDLFRGIGAALAYAWAEGGDFPGPRFGGEIFWPEGPGAALGGTAFVNSALFVLQKSAVLAGFL
jgi:hypothetical protein